MATETITLTDSEYVQITDGANNAYMTVVSWPGFSEVWWADSPSKPATNAPGAIELVSYDRYNNLLNTICIRLGFNVKNVSLCTRRR